VAAERELEAPPPPSAAAEAVGFGDIISPESLGACAWSDAPVQVGLLLDSRWEVRFGVTATARERPRLRCFARDGTQIPSSGWDSDLGDWDTVSWAAGFHCLPDNSNNYTLPRIPLVSYINLYS
jgi:hypothetical protein